MSKSFFTLSEAGITPPVMEFKIFAQELSKKLTALLNGLIATIKAFYRSTGHDEATRKVSCAVLWMDGINIGSEKSA